MSRTMSIKSVDTLQDSDKWSNNGDDSNHTNMSTTATRSSTMSATMFDQSSVGSNVAKLIPLSWDRVELVGREAERECLLKSFRRIQSVAQSDIILVKGESGCGKSALVKSMEQNVEKSGGLFCSGKYGQYDASQRSCGGLVDAVTELAFQIEQSKFCDAIQARVRQALTSTEIENLIKIMPCVELIMKGASSPHGPETETDGLTTDEHAFHTFEVLLRSFLNAIATPKLPVVLFLDDLQWADDASKRLLQTLAASSSTKISNLLLIGAVRLGEEGSDSIDFASNTKIHITTLHLKPLQQNDINRILAAVTEHSEEDTEVLTTTVYRKTMGNPYFCLQYLDMLHRQGFLVFSFKTCVWEWDMQAIHDRTNVSENVVQVLIDKISAQPQAVQLLVMVAALMGFTFNPEIVYTVITSTSVLDALEQVEDLKDVALMFRNDTVESSYQAAFADLLKKATQAGLLEEPMSYSTNYKFSHDRVRQSAMALFPSGPNGDALGYTIGETLLNLCDLHPNQDWMLFTSVDLMLKKASTNNSETDMQHEMVLLCLKAARQASTKGLFISSADYADQGLSLLDENSRWKDNYKMCLELFQLSADMHYSYGNFERSEAAVKEIMANATSLNDKIMAYSVSIATKGAQCDLKGGLEQGAFLLKELGFRFPSQPNQLQVNWFILKGLKLLKKRKPSDLLNLPRMTDRTLIETTKVLHKLSVYDWRSGQSNLLVIHTVIMMQLTLEHGVGNYGPYAFSLWGACMAHGGRFEEACEYGNLTLELLKRPETQDCYASAVKVVHLIFYHLKKPLFDSLGAMLKAYEMAKKVGNVEIAAYCLQGHAMFGLIVGMPLDDLVQEMKGYCDFCNEFRQYAVLMEILPFYQLAMNLMGNCDDPLALSGEIMKEQDFLNRLKSMNEGSVAEVLLTYAKVMLLYLYGELELADVERRKITPDRDTISTYYMKYLNYFFSAMICLGLAKKGKKMYYKREARPYIKKLREYAALGSVNAVPLLKLVIAEKKSLNDGNRDVDQMFLEAVAMAGRCGYRLVKAVACERVGEYMISRDNSRAVTYLLDAVDEYSEYRAYGKVRQLKHKQRALLQQSSRELTTNKRSSSKTLQPFSVASWKTDFKRSDSIPEQQL